MSVLMTTLSFHSHANKAHFYKKCCALGLILKVTVFETLKCPIEYLIYLYIAVRSAAHEIKAYLRFKMFAEIHSLASLLYSSRARKRNKREFSAG